MRVQVYAIGAMAAIFYCASTGSAHVRDPGESRVSMAYELSSQELYDFCRAYDDANEEVVRQLMCHGYITGVRDGIGLGSAFAATEDRLFCIPKLDRERETIKDVVVRYLEANKDRRESPAAVSVALALKREFPCAGKPRL